MEFVQHPVKWPKMDSGEEEGVLTSRPDVKKVAWYILFVIANCS